MWSLNKSVWEVECPINTKSKTCKYIATLNDIDKNYFLALISNVSPWKLLPAI